MVLFTTWFPNFMSRFKGMWMCFIISNMLCHNFSAHFTLNAIFLSPLFATSSNQVLEGHHKCAEILLKDNLLSGENLDKFFVTESLGKGSIYVGAQVFPPLISYGTNALFYILKDLHH